MKTPRTRIRNGSWLLGLAAGLIAVAPPASAQQQSQARQQQADAGQAQAQVVTSVNVEVIVLHGTNSDAGASIDPAIGKMPELQQPPFSAYNTYKLVGTRTPLVVSRSAPTSTELPNKRTLQIVLRDVLQGGRFKIDTSISEPGGTAFLPQLSVTAPAGKTYFVAGQTYNRGMLFIGITVLK